MKNTLLTILIVLSFVAALAILDDPKGLDAQAGRRVIGTGEIEVIAGTDPAAGIEISQTVPTGFAWRLLAVTATLVTSAVAANREASLVLDDGTNIFARIPTSQNHAASLTRRVGWFHGATPAAVVTDTTLQAGLPNDVILGAGFRVRIITTNLDAGDNWSAPILLVERFRP